MESYLEKFEELESRILGVVELLKTTRTGKESAEKELSGARGRISELEKELDELRRERDMVKIKVESLLKNLSELTEETVV